METYISEQTQNLTIKCIFKREQFYGKMKEKKRSTREAINKQEQESK